MKKALILLICCCFLIKVQSQVSKTIDVVTPGTLSTLLTVEEKSTITDLTVTGDIDARDVKCMRDEITKLAILDLSAVIIKKYTGTLGTNTWRTHSYNSTTYVDNVMPMYSFCNSLTYEGKITLTDIKLPNSLNSIGYSSFKNCTNLFSIIISDSVTEISSGAFQNTGWYNKQPDGVLYLNNLLYGYKGIMPVNTSIELKDGTTAITGDGFYHFVNLTSIIVPKSVTGISEQAFAGCERLASINLPSSIKYISSGAFVGCSSLKSIIIPNSVDSIGSNAFQFCTGLTNLFIPSSIISTGEGVFSYCSGLTSVVFQDSVTTIFNGEFYFCTSLKSVTIPQSVILIEPNAFKGCTSLNAINIPNSITEIGSEAFSGCSSLTSLTIPNSVNSIGYNAFFNCSSLISFYVNNQSPTSISLGTYIFTLNDYSGPPKGCTLYVPSGSKSAYQAANQWKDFTNIIEYTTAVPSVIDEKVKIHPSVVTDGFQLSGIANYVKLSLFDINGKELLSKSITENEHVSLGSISPGFYIVKIMTSEGIIDRKIIKL